MTEYTKELRYTDYIPAIPAEETFTIDSLYTIVIGGDSDHSTLHTYPHVSMQTKPSDYGVYGYGIEEIYNITAGRYVGVDGLKYIEPHAIGRIDSIEIVFDPRVVSPDDVVKIKYYRAPTVLDLSGVANYINNFYYDSDIITKEGLSNLHRAVDSMDMTDFGRDDYPFGNGSYTYYPRILTVNNDNFPEIKPSTEGFMSLLSWKSGVDVDPNTSRTVSGKKYVNFGDSQTAYTVANPTGTETRFTYDETETVANHGKHPNFYENGLRIGDELLVGVDGYNSMTDSDLFSNTIIPSATSPIARTITAVSDNFIQYDTGVAPTGGDLSTKKAGYFDTFKMRSKWNITPFFATHITVYSASPAYVQISVNGSMFETLMIGSSYDDANFFPSSFVYSDNPTKIKAAVTSNAMDDLDGSGFHTTFDLGGIRTNSIGVNMKIVDGHGTPEHWYVECGGWIPLEDTGA